MNITLYAATSIDGFIAKADGDSEWVSEHDEQAFVDTIQEAGCLMVGKTTYKQYLDELYPMEGVANIVLSSGAIESRPHVHTASSPSQAIDIAEKLGHEQAILVGGGHTNASFIEADLIDDLIISIHPLVLGSGIRLFETNTTLSNWETKKQELLPDGVVKLWLTKKEV